MTTLEIVLLALLVFVVWLVIAIVYTVDATLYSSKRTKVKTFVFTWPLMVIVGSLDFILSMFEGKRK